MPAVMDPPAEATKNLSAEQQADRPRPHTVLRIERMHFSAETAEAVRNNLRIAKNANLIVAKQKKR